MNLHDEIDYKEIAPEAVDAMGQLGSASEQSDIEDALVAFVKLRASQLNGCPYCVDLHTQESKDEGEDERRIAAVAAWRESPFFTERERAALALTEALTRMADGPVSNTVYRTVDEQFSEEEFVALVLMIVSINAWNRVWVSFQTPAIPEL